MLCRSPFGGEGRPFSAGEEGIWKMTRPSRGCARLLRRGGSILGVRGPGSLEFARRDVEAGVRPGVTLAESVRGACGPGDSMLACRLWSRDISLASRRVTLAF